MENYSYRMLEIYPENKLAKICEQYLSHHCHRAAFMINSLLLYASVVKGYHGLIYSEVQETI